MNTYNIFNQHIKPIHLSLNIENSKTMKFCLDAF